MNNFAAAQSAAEWVIELNEEFYKFSSFSRMCEFVEQRGTPEFIYFRDVDGGLVRWMENL